MHNYYMLSEITPSAKQNELAWTTHNRHPQMSPTPIKCCADNRNNNYMTPIQIYTDIYILRSPHFTNCATVNCK